MAISSIGVGSGLPVQDLLADLRASESQALNVIKSRQSVAQSRVSAYGTIKSAVETLQTAATNLAKPETFGALKASTSGAGLSASVSSEAIAGSYNVTVRNLATAQSLVTEGVADRSAANGTDGVITFTYGDGSTKTLDLTGEDTSIDSLIAAINGDESLGLQATVLNDGDANSPYRLILTASSTGTDAAVTGISVAGNTDLDTLLSGLPGSANEQAATNSLIEINGIEITRQTNTVEDAIEGVTLTLNEADPDKALNLSITRDNEAATKAVTNFVNAYNSLQGTIRSLTSFNTETQARSVLTGDSMARRVQSEVRDILNSSSSEGAIRSLADLGIEFNHTNGELKLDNSKLSEALKNNLGDATSFLQGPTGVTERMAQITGRLLGTGGLIASATTGASRTVEDLGKQYETASARIDSRMAIYQKQFSALDSMISQMNSVSSYLTSQLSALENLSNQASKK